MQSKAITADEYLAELQPERCQAIAAVRKVILDNLPEGYEEIMDFGMIAYVIPLSRYAKTYNGHPLGLAALASQKNYMSVYLMNVYGDKVAEKWFIEEYKASGKKLDMGKSCIRFKRLGDLPLDLIGKAVGRTSVDRYIAYYEAAKAQRSKG